MMLFRRIAALAIVGVLAIPVAGCANDFGQKISNVFTAAATATVDPKAIIIAANTFDGLQATAKHYLRLPRCSAVSGPVCRNPEITPSIITAMRSGRDARKKALTFVKTHPGQLGPQGVYDALQGAVGELQSLFATYNIGGL